MVFCTFLFLFHFLPAVLLAYHVAPALLRGLGVGPAGESRFRNLLLLLASYVFYGWWDPWFIPLMLVVTAANYLCGRIIHAAGEDRRRRRAGVVAAVVISLGILGFFKYFVFLQENVNAALAAVGLPAVPILPVTLPMGISFYVFQALSYALDVHRRAAPPARSFADFACFIALYPQLVAGPIVRYGDVAAQLVARSHGLEKISSGIALFILGLGKKVLLADPVGEVADASFSAASLGAADAWFGVVAYALQIYFDFSGYSDMAIGLGRMIGFEFPRNFDAPYRAESITDFWRRWHISLSTFLRDYLYIPLGGNRLGPRRTYLNLAVVMLLGGLWHGAAWSFVAWGAYHGALLALERGLGKRSPVAWLPRPARVSFTFVLVLFAWVLFRAETLGAAGRYLAAMLGAGGDGLASILLPVELYRTQGVVTVAVAAAVVAAPIQAHDWSRTITAPKALALVPAFALSVLAMVSRSFHPFLYFQF